MKVGMLLTIVTSRLEQTNGSAKSVLGCLEH